MTRKPLISCDDIEPNRVYLAVDNREYKPVKIICTEEPGYLRGLVKVDGFHSNGFFYTAVAYGQLLGSRELIKIGVTRIGQESWKFLWNNQRTMPSLFALPPGWEVAQREKLENAKNLLERQIAMVNRELEVLEKEFGLDTTLKQ